MMTVSKVGSTALKIVSAIQTVDLSIDQLSEHRTVCTLLLTQGSKRN